MPVELSLRRAERCFFDDHQQVTLVLACSREACWRPFGAAAALWLLASGHCLVLQQNCRIIEVVTVSLSFFFYLFRIGKLQYLDIVARNRFCLSALVHCSRWHQLPAPIAGLHLVTFTKRANGVVCWHFFFQRGYYTTNGLKNEIVLGTWKKKVVFQVQLIWPRSRAWFSGNVAWKKSHFCAFTQNTAHSAYINWYCGLNIRPYLGRVFWGDFLIKGF